MEIHFRNHRGWNPLWHLVCFSVPPGRKDLSAQIDESLHSGARLLGTRQFDLALPAFLRVMELNPGNQTAQRGLNQCANQFLNLAQAAISRKDVAAATELVRKAAEAKPDDLMTVNRLSVLKAAICPRADFAVPEAPAPKRLDPLPVPPRRPVVKDYAEEPRPVVRKAAAPVKEEKAAPAVPPLPHVETEAERYIRYQNLSRAAGNYFARGDYARAVEFYRGALKIAPPNIQIELVCWMHLAKLCEKFPFAVQVKEKGKTGSGDEAKIIRCARRLRQRLVVLRFVSSNWTWDLTAIKLNVPDIHYWLTNSQGYRVFNGLKEAQVAAGLKEDAEITAAVIRTIQGEFEAVAGKDARLAAKV